MFGFELRFQILNKINSNRVIRVCFKIFLNAELQTGDEKKIVFPCS